MHLHCLTIAFQTLKLAANSVGVKPEVKWVLERLRFAKLARQICLPKLIQPICRPLVSVVAVTWQPDRSNECSWKLELEAS